MMAKNLFNNKTSVIACGNMQMNIDFPRSLIKHRTIAN